MITVPAALLCEIEGVIVDTLRPRSTAMRQALTMFDVSVSEDEVRAAVRGRTTAEALLRVPDCAARLDDAEQAIATLDADRRFTQLLAEGVMLASGAAEFLASVHGRLPLAAVTRARRDDVALMLKPAALHDMFSFVISADEVVSMKPDPAGYRMAIARLTRTRQFASRQVLALEDGASGVAAARDAGARPIAVGEMSQEDAFRADAWLPTLRGQSLHTIHQLIDAEARGVG